MNEPKRWNRNNDQNVEQEGGRVIKLICLCIILICNLAILITTMRK